MPWPIPPLPDGEHEALLVRYHDLTDYFRREEGYSIDLRVTQVLEGLGFAQERTSTKPAETFSGGWQMRIALAKLLLGRPDLLLLDEPTNHLDLDARNWLEEYLIALPARGDPGLARPLLPRRGRHRDRRPVAAHDHRLRRHLLEVPRRARRPHGAAAQGQAGPGRRSGADEGVHRSVPLPGHQGRAGAEPHQDARQDRADRSAARAQARALHVSDVPEERAHRARARPTSRKAYGDNVVFDDLNLHIERGDRIALVAPNGAGKSTLMRMLAGARSRPIAARAARATRSSCSTSRRTKPTGSSPTRTVYETLEADSPIGMVPMIRNILGGFLFSGDDIYKKAGVLSGGERTRLAVARMLLRPANTLLLDEPTNHLDLDSKDVLLDALEDFGGTLIFVSHDRYFVDRLATKIIEVGHGTIEVYPGHLRAVPLEPRSSARRSRPPRPPARAAEPRAPGRARGTSVPPGPRRRGTAGSLARPAPARRRPPPPRPRRRPTRTRSGRTPMTAPAQARHRGPTAPRSADLETRIADCEREVKELEAQMAAPGFYDDRQRAEAVVTRHQALMWEVGDLMHQLGSPAESRAESRFEPLRADYNL